MEGNVNKVRNFARMVGATRLATRANRVGNTLYFQCVVTLFIVYDHEQTMPASIVYDIGKGRVVAVEDINGNHIDEVRNPRTLDRFTYDNNKERYVRM